MYSKLNEFNYEKAHENFNLVMDDGENEPDFNDMDEKINEIECSSKRFLKSDTIILQIPNDRLETIIEGEIKLIIQKEQKSRKNQILKSLTGELFSVSLLPPRENGIVLKGISLISSKSCLFFF